MKVAPAPPSLSQHIDAEIRKFIIKEKHLCVMANTVISMDRYELHLHDKLGTKGTADKLITELQDYVANYNFSDNKFKTFIAVFPEEQIVSEIEFENLMWRQLQFLHEKDPTPWDPTVSSEPLDNNFSFSIAG